MLKLANGANNNVESFLPTQRHLKRKATVYTRKHIRKLNLVGDMKSVSSSIENNKRQAFSAQRDSQTQNLHQWGNANLPPFNNETSFELSSLPN